MNKCIGFQLIAAPYTPMDDKGDVNLEVIGKYVMHLLDTGVSGAFVCGTSGEGPSLTVEERKAVIEEWVAHSAKRLKIICHVGGNSIRECQDLASHAERAGANAISAISPFFFKPRTPEELAGFLSEVAIAAPSLPFYYYHMPAITEVNIPVNQLLKLVHNLIPNFSGVKYTHNDLFDMQKCLIFKPGKYEIFHGYDETMLCGLSIGANSAVGSTYNYMSNIYFAIFESFNACDMTKARLLQQYSVAIINLINKFGGGVRAGKAIMCLLGIECGSCRSPIQTFTKEEFIDLKKQLDSLNFFSVIKQNSPIVAL